MSNSPIPVDRVELTERSFGSADDGYTRAIRKLSFAVYSQDRKIINDWINDTVDAMHDITGKQKFKKKMRLTIDMEGVFPTEMSDSSMRDQCMVTWSIDTMKCLVIIGETE